MNRILHRTLGAFLSTATSALALYQGPVPAIAGGYGAPGRDSVAVESLANPHWNANPIFVFHPSGRTSPVPTIFYSHAYGGDDTLYQIEFLRHMVSRGYAAVFVPYRTYLATVEERYATLLDGFRSAARSFPQIIDTSRIGFFGHSFGAGATPYIAFQLFAESNWGKRAKFIFLSAPWYALDLGDTALARFPADCPLLMALYDDDTVNDHRLGMDVFRSIAIPDSMKDLLLVRSDTVSGYVYQADHNLPSQYSPTSGEYDAYDSRITFRLMDALADYAFNGSDSGREVALGGGGPRQVDLGGGLAPLEETDFPTPAHPESRYEFPCDTVFNPRRSHCETPSTVRASSPRPRAIQYLSPDRIRIPGGEDSEVLLRSPSGAILARTIGPELSVAGLAPGIYLVQAGRSRTFRYLRANR